MVVGQQFHRLGNISVRSAVQFSQSAAQLDAFGNLVSCCNQTGSWFCRLDSFRQEVGCLVFVDAGVLVIGIEDRQFEIRFIRSACQCPFQPFASLHIILRNADAIPVHHACEFGGLCMTFACRKQRPAKGKARHLVIIGFRPADQVGGDLVHAVDIAGMRFIKRLANVFRRVGRKSAGARNHACGEYNRKD